MTAPGEALAQPFCSPALRDWIAESYRAVAPRSLVAGLAR